MKQSLADLKRVVRKKGMKEWEGREGEGRRQVTGKERSDFEEGGRESCIMSSGVEELTRSIIRLQPQPPLLAMIAEMEGSVNIVITSAARS